LVGVGGLDRGRKRSEDTALGKSAGKLQSVESRDIGVEGFRGSWVRSVGLLSVVPRGDGTVNFVTRASISLDKSDLTLEM
jgi:hypothetical protein